MTHRAALVFFALSLLPAVVACGDDEPPPPRETVMQLNGTYRPLEQGRIASITFSNGKDYFLVPSGCSGGGCTDVGTYRLDTAARTVVLENADTHRTRTIALADVKTADVATSLVKSLTPREDLTDPSENPLVQTGQRTGSTGNQTAQTGQEVGSSENELAQALNQLFQTIIQAIMDGQKMKQDEGDEDEDKDEKKPEPDPKDCKQGIPTQTSTQAERDAYAARCPNGP